MLITDIPAALLLMAQLFFVVAAIIFAVSGIDDLFIDLYFYIRSLYRRLWVRRKYAPLSVDQMMEKSEQPFAIMLPAWQEADVLFNAVTNILNTIDYGNYQIFIGTYPNDAATQRQADALAQRFPNVHKVVCPLPGPTCKADCLNAIIGRIFRYEGETQTKFTGVIMHDAEDVVHPLSLRLFNYLMPRFDLIQIPVLSLERKWTNLTGGHYMDEFAEFHSKEIIVRESLAGIVPGAGVGTAYSHAALQLASEQGEIFNTSSLTEDYEFSLRTYDNGLKQIFARVPVTRRLTYRRRGGGERERTVTDYIATKEYFPSQFWAAVRQKTRWTTGIALQSWQHLGWRGNWRLRYLLWRDRRMLGFSHAIALGYLAILVFALLYLYTTLVPDGYRLAPLLHADNPFWYVVYFNLAVLAHRVVQRHIWSFVYYGWSALPMVVPRYIWGTIINYVAVCRAIKIYAHYLVTGQAIGWDKTSHEFPDAQNLARYKRRLGDLLLERNFLTPRQLQDALEEQRETRQQLGRILMRRGLITEAQLLRVLGVQLRLPVNAIDPFAISAALYTVLPYDMLRLHQLIPIRWTEAGALLIACNSVPDQAAVDEIQTAAGAPVEFCLAALSDIVFALHVIAQHTEVARQHTAKSLADARATPELKQTAARERYQPFGAFILQEKHLTEHQLDECVEQAARENTRLGGYLVKQGIITESTRERILGAMHESVTDHHLAVSKSRREQSDGREWRDQRIA